MLSQAFDNIVTGYVKQINCNNPDEVLLQSLNQKFIGTLMM